MAHTTLVDPKNSATITWCEIRGVPRGVLHGLYDTEWARRVCEFQYNDRPVSVKRQRDWFALTNAQVTEGAPFIAVCGTNQNVIDQIAFYCWLTAYYHSNKIATAANPAVTLPYWHLVTGARQDELRDDRLRRELMAPPNFLVLSGVSQGASFAKTEKVRDLLALYDHVPRVLVLGTADPAAYFNEHLHMTPNRIIFVGGSGAAASAQPAAPAAEGARA